MSTGFLQFGHKIFDRNPRSVSILGTPARISSSKYIPKSSPGNLLAWHRGQTKHGMSKTETATTRDLPPKAPTLVSCIGVLHVLHFGGLSPSRGIVALDLIIRMPGTGSELFQFDSGASEVGVVCKSEPQFMQNKFPCDGRNQEYSSHVGQKLFVPLTK